MPDNKEILAHQNAIKSIYREFLKTDAGVDLYGHIETLTTTSLNNALTEPDALKAHALLQKAHAYKTIQSYLDRMNK